MPTTFKVKDYPMIPVTQVNTGGGMSTIATDSFSATTSTSVRSVTFIVPANAAYQFVSSGAATSAITSIYELTL